MRIFKTFGISPELNELLISLQSRTELKLVTVFKKALEAYERELNEKEGK